MEKAIDSLPMNEPAPIVRFVQEIFEIWYVASQFPHSILCILLSSIIILLTSAEVYQPSSPSLSTSEATWNSVLIEPVARACTKLLRKTTNYGACFIPGEVKLRAMTRQLSKHSQEAQHYNADGLVRAKNVNGPEVVILETSGGLNKADQTKIGFDHIKAMFGTLAMLKEIADIYEFGSFDCFAQVKVHFLHAHGKSSMLLDRVVS